MSLQNTIKYILPQNWVMHAPFEGEVCPTHLARSRGMEIELQRKGYKPIDWKYGRGGEIHIWLMPQEYKPGVPPSYLWAQTLPAHEIELWQDRRIFIWGSGGKDWPEWQEEIKSVLGKTREDSRMSNNGMQRTALRSAADAQRSETENCLYANKEVSGSMHPGMGGGWDGVPGGFFDRLPPDIQATRIETAPAVP